MSKMCKLGSTCNTKHGMCSHEKMMFGMMAIIGVAAVVIWVV
jgi:hypothetical protein